jgi:hypothetical protein
MELLLIRYSNLLLDLTRSSEATPMTSERVAVTKGSDEKTTEGNTNNLPD